MRPYVKILSNRDFALFWSGFTVSNIGDNLSCVALVWLVYDATGSSEKVGLFLFLYSAPAVLGGLVAGALLDRFDRRRLVILDNALRAAAFAAVSLLSWAGHLRIWHLAVLAVTYGSLTTLTLAGGPTLVPSLVPRQQLATANAFETIGFGIGEIVGRSLAAVLLTAVSASAILLLDSASYLIFVACLLRMRPGGGGARLPPAPVVKSLVEGFSFLTHTRILPWTTLGLLVVNLGAGSLGVLVPAVAETVPEGGARLFGLLMLNLSAGQLCGSLLAGAWSPRVPLGRALAMALVFAGIAFATLRAARVPTQVAASLFFFGVALALVNVWVQVLRMRAIPPALLGRLFGIIRTSIRATLPLSVAVAGFLAPRLGLQSTVVLMATCVAVPGLVALMTGAFEERGRGPALPRRVTDHPRQQRRHRTWQIR